VHNLLILPRASSSSSSGARRSSLDRLTARPWVSSPWSFFPLPALCSVSQLDALPTPACLSACPGTSSATYLPVLGSWPEFSLPSPHAAPSLCSLFFSARRGVSSPRSDVAWSPSSLYSAPFPCSSQWLPCSSSLLPWRARQGCPCPSRPSLPLSAWTPLPPHPGLLPELPGARLVPHPNLYSLVLPACSFGAATLAVDLLHRAPALLAHGAVASPWCLAQPSRFISLCSSASSAESLCCVPGSPSVPAPCSSMVASRMFRCSCACCREAPYSVLLHRVVVRAKLLTVDIESVTRSFDTVKRCVCLCPSPPGRNLALLSASLFAGSSPMLPHPYFSLLCRAIIASIASSLATVILTASARDCGRVHRICQRSVADSTIVASDSFACCRASRFPCPVLAQFSVRQRALSARLALIPISSSTSPRHSSSVVLVAVPYCAY
jgi:hypothetical protein